MDIADTAEAAAAVTRTQAALDDLAVAIENGINPATVAELAVEAAQAANTMNTRIFQLAFPGRSST